LRGDAWFLAANGRPLAQQPLGALLFGQLRTPDGQAEEVVVCRLTADCLELHCHGGEAAAARVRDVLTAAGVVVMERGKRSPGPTWPPTVASSGGEGPLGLRAGLRENRAERESRLRELVLRAATPRTAAIAHAQYRGALAREVSHLLNRPVWDGSEGAVLRSLIALAPVGRHLVDPFLVGVVGRPNVGKSRLVNALLGFERTIVLDRPGTTRDVLTAETAHAGWPIRLADTAGWRVSGDALEQQGIARAEEWLAEADLVLLVLDGSQPLTPTDRGLYEQYPGALCVGSKGDLAPAWELAEVAGARRVSAQTGAGLGELLDTLVEQLVPKVPAPGGGVPTSPGELACLTEAASELERGETARAREWLSWLVDM